MDVDQVLQRLGPLSTASHETAARLWRIELVERGADRVTVPRARARAHAAGWLVRRADLAVEDVVVVDGIRCTTPLRTVHDLARVLPLAQAVAAADSAVRQGFVELGDLVALLSSARGRGAAGPRAVASSVDPLAGSVLESLLCVLLLCAGLPVPVAQFVACEPAGTFVARVDFAWPSLRLVVEAHGFAFHDDRAAYRSDRRGANALERLGWRVLRFSWEDVVGSPEEVVRTVRACLDAAAA